MTIVVPADKNPFAIRHVTSIPFFFEIGTWDSHLHSLGELNFRAAIVGGQGTGKTTLLEELQNQLRECLSRSTHHLFLPRERCDHGALLEIALAQAKQGAILLVDGIERLTIFQRLRLYRKSTQCPGLIVNAHKKTMLPTWFRSQPTQKTLDYLLEQLNIRDPSILTIAEQLFRKHQPNLRLVFRELYDRFANQDFD